MRHPSGLRPEVWARLFEHHVTYHAWLGVAAMLLYVRDNFLASLLRVDSFRALVEARKVFLVRCASGWQNSSHLQRQLAL